MCNYCIFSIQITCRGLQKRHRTKIHYANDCLFNRNRRIQSGNSGTGVVIDSIRKAFLLSENEFGYEINVRNALSQIWLQIFKMCASVLQEKKQSANSTADKLKRMMIYIHEHYSEKISVPELAETAFLSERECYRTFRNHLHMTPVEYIKSYRIQAARQMLADSQIPITEIGYACG